MKKITYILSSLLIIASCTSTHTDWYKESRENMPFLRWWWLGGAVNQEGLTYNLEEFAAKGFGGVEITSLYGVQGNEENDRAYLSPEWMEAVKYTSQECKRLGLQMDMSNCNGWPFGGPWISPEYAAKTFSFNADTTAVEIIGTGQYVKRAGEGGHGLVMDHYSKEALREYVKAFDNAFAQSGCPWPNTLFNDSFEVYGSGWAEDLPEAFFRDHGYRIEDHLKAFAANDGSEESKRTIADYRSTLASLYMENFVKPWNAWVRSHGCQSRNQAHGSPANLIDVYAEADIPECEAFGQSPFDIKGLHHSGDTRLNDSDPAVFKFASSAAHITGKKYTSCETLTWLTEHFHTTLALCKPEIDLAFASGVNHVYLHGAPYSPKGIDFPGWKFYATINLSPSNPSIWEVCEPLTQYITRCQAFLTAGDPDADFLLYFPEHDVWNHHFPTQFMQLDIHKMHLTMPIFKQDVLNIIKKGYDIDYISDKFLSSVKVCRDGSLKTIGGAKYKALILPTETEYMPETTQMLIADLRRQGASVLTISQLEERDFVSEEIMGIEGIHAVRRTNECGGKNYFVANLGPEDIDQWVDLATTAEAVEFFDAMTGVTGMAETRPSKNVACTSVRVQIASGASLLIKTFPRYKDCGQKWQYIAAEPTDKILLSDNGWALRFERSAPQMPHNEYKFQSITPWNELEGGTINEAIGVYTTSFILNKKPETAILRLGNVYESAEVYINNSPAGILISAPFDLDITRFLIEGENTIDIKVRNLPANRIAQMDRDGMVWRIFKDVNIAAVKSRQVVSYEKVDHYGWWPVVTSGLTGPISVDLYD